MREKQTDEGQEAPIQPQIALTTEKKARFLQCQCDRSPVRTGMFHYNTDIASQFFECGCQLFKSLFVWWTSKGRSTISPPGLRTATVLLLFDTSIPTAVITAASIFLTFASTSVQLKQCFVLSAHLHCSLGLGICIAHWL